MACAMPAKLFIIRYSFKPINPFVDSLMCSPRAKVEVKVAKNMKRAAERVFAVKASVIQSETKNLALPELTLG